MHFREVLNQLEPSETDFWNKEEESVLESYMGEIALEETDRAIRSLEGGEAQGLECTVSQLSNDRILDLLRDMLEYL